MNQRGLGEREGKAQAPGDFKPYPFPGRYRRGRSAFRRSGILVDSTRQNSDRLFEGFEPPPLTFYLLGSLVAPLSVPLLSAVLSKPRVVDPVSLLDPSSLNHRIKKSRNIFERPIIKSYRDFIIFLT
jgi:hypothetical protein